MTQLAEKPTALTPQLAVLDVGGMKCAGCVRAVEQRLLQQAGVTTATVNLLTEVAAVEYDSAQVHPQQLAEQLSQAGFPSQARSADDGTAVADWAMRQRDQQQAQIWRGAIAAGLLGFSILGHLRHVGGLQLPIVSTIGFHALLATLTLAGPARSILVEGWQGLRRGTPSMNTLVSLGAMSAYTASLVALLVPGLGWECFFDEPVMLLSFILLGRTLEDRARFRAADALRSLVALQPTVARLVPGSQRSASAASEGVQIPAVQAQVGEWLRVLPGEKIPADGVITVGETTVDEAMLTGESLPVLKQEGDAVTAGTLNQSGAVTLQVTQTGQETTLAKMIALVEAAQTRKAPVQRLADAIAGYFTYGVLTLAALTFGFWFLIGLPLWPSALASGLGAGHAHHAMTLGSSAVLVSLKLAIAVLVVACPCALGLATPMAILVGSGLGADRGLLVRGGDSLELLQRLDTLVFDKTGTLTTGSPQLTDCLSWQPTRSDQDLLQLAATVESGTRHPIAVALQTAAADLPLLPAERFQTVAGAGVAAWVGQPAVPVRLGTLAWVQVAVPAEAIAQAKTLAEAGKTVVYVSVAEQFAGLIAVADPLRQEAAAVLDQLQSQGLAIQVLSGDRLETVRAVGQQLGLDPTQVMGSLAPADKVAAIQMLQEDGHRVGFVGDGINDAPALAQADVSLTLVSGTDIARETADVLLMRDRLGDVAAAIALSRATYRKIQQNLVWAFAYNLVCIPLAAGVALPTWGVTLSPGLAGGLMAFSSLGVVLNALTLRWQLPSA